jgi:preprotein translocase subunit SecD
VSGPQEMIADALREIAAQARAPRPMADAAWRAGRRRRLAALTASAVAGAAAIVAAVLLPLAAHGQPPSRPPSLQGPTPVSLRSPIQFRQVAAISNASCPAGSGGLPGTLPDSAAPACVYLTGTGMTVTVLQSAQVIPSGSGGYLLEIGFTRPETGPFAALTLRLSGLPSPRDQLAVIIHGRVIADPAVQSTITGGTAQIAGFATRAQAESLLSSLRNQ